MEYIYTALLLHSAKKEINEENVKKVLTASGITPDDAKVKALIASLEGVNIDEALEKATVAMTTTEKAEEKKEEVKEEKEEEKKAEEAAAGLSALFG
jgi:large subunit ribosomal protein L12